MGEILAKIQGKFASPGDASGILCNVPKDFNGAKIYIIDNLSTDIVIDIIQYSDYILGVVSYGGSIVSHGAALLRAKNIPCLVLNQNIDEYIGCFVYLYSTKQELVIMEQDDGSTL